MTTTVEKLFCLQEELETSHKLIIAGFGALQEIDFSNEFYHLPHQLLASGLERLMKCYILLVYEDREGSYPDQAYMRKLGHDLVRLLGTICTSFYGGTTRPLIQQEFDFVKTDQTLNECIRILSLFGKKGRYYNLDILSGSLDKPIDPKSEWETLESRIEDIAPFLDKPELLHRDYYPRVHSKLIAKLERFVRAIALQFTCGDHADQFGRLGSMSIVYTDFRNLEDQEFGTKEYRRSVSILQQEKENWIKRDEQEILNGQWPTRIVTKREFGKEWPFRSDRIIVEYRENLFCIVSIEGYEFALNGAARSRFKIPWPHEAGVAVLGKSVGPFIDMARSLRGGGR